MPVKVFSSAVFGIEASLITVEVDCSSGLKYFIVGLPDSAVKESLLRIESAIKNSNYRMPRKKIVINLAPADLRKEGSAYDLAIALGILAGSEQISADHIGEYLVLGEVALDGSIMPVKGVLPVAIMARDRGFKGIILPAMNAREAAIVNNLEVLPVNSLAEIIKFFKGAIKIAPLSLNTRELFLQI